MTLAEAMAQQAAWLNIWMPILFAGAFVLPLALLIRRASRATAILCILAGGIGAVTIDWMYSQMGYVKLLGLPHIILWTPLAVYLFRQIKREDMPKAPKVIMMIVLAVIAISLAFDYTDAIRYALGERTPLVLPAEA